MTRTKALFAVLAFLALSAGYADWQVLRLSGHVAANQRSDTQALCSFRADLQHRLDSSLKFLASHPHGIPGISGDAIRVSADNQQRSLRSLKALVCPEGGH